MGFYDEIAPSRKPKGGGFYARIKAKPLQPATAGAKPLGPSDIPEPVADVVGKVAGTIMAPYSTAKAYAVRGLTGGTEPIKYGPTASVEQFADLKRRMEADQARMVIPGELLPSPLVMDLATDLPFVKAANVAGARALLPGGRALANAEIGGMRIRALPGIKQAGEALKPGFSLPNAVRDQYRALIREAEGTADWNALVREKNLQAGLNLPAEAQTRIGTAIEKRAIDALPPGEQAVAEAIVAENRKMVTERIAKGLPPDVLGGIGGSELEYLARVPTPEFRKSLSERGKAYGEYIPMPARGAPRTLKGRVLPPGVTAEEFNAAQKAETGKAAFLPPVEGTLAKGVMQDMRNMRADVARGLLKFSVPAAPGETDLTSHAIYSGFSEGFKGSLKGRKFTGPVADLADNLSKRLAPQEWGKVRATVDFVNNQFRKWALFSPGFLSRNWQNNVVQGAIFGNTDPRTYAEAGRQWFALQKAKTLADLNPKDLADVREAVKLGVIGRGQAAQETARGGSREWAIFKGARFANQMGEDTSRFAYFKWAKAHGYTPLKAAERVDNIFFNYSPRFQSPVVKGLRRNAVPFINWRMNIPQLFVRSAIERPGSFGMVGSIPRRINQLAGVSPDSLARLGPDVVSEGGIVEGPGKQPGTLRVAEPQGFGTFDVNDIVNDLKAGPGGWARLAAANTFPQWSILAGEAVPTGRGQAGYSFFLQKPYEYPGGKASMTTAPAMLKALTVTPDGVQFLKEHGFEVQPNGSIKGPTRTVAYLNAFPQFRLANIMADILKPDPNSEFRIKSFALGLREVERDPNFKPGRRKK